MTGRLIAGNASVVTDIVTKLREADRRYYLRKALLAASTTVTFYTILRLLERAVNGVLKKRR